MRRIIEILGVEEWVKDNKRHSRTYAILEDGTEATGYGSDFNINDEVMVYYHHETVKMEKKDGRKQSWRGNTPQHND